MDSSTIAASIVEQSGLSKSALSSASGVSRALLDDYLKGRRHPSIAQLTRLADAASLTLTLSVEPRPKALPAAFLAVLEFGEIFPRSQPKPLLDLSPIWRRAAQLTARGWGIHPAAARSAPRRPPSSRGGRHRARCR